VKWGNRTEGTLRSKGRRRKMGLKEGTMSKTQGLDQCQSAKRATDRYH